MSKRVSNKKGTTHQPGVRPARSLKTGARHRYNRERRIRLARIKEMREISRANITRRFAPHGRGGITE